MIGNLVAAVSLKIAVSDFFAATWENFGAIYWWLWFPTPTLWLREISVCHSHYCSVTYHPHLGRSCRRQSGRHWWDEEIWGGETRKPGASVVGIIVVKLTDLGLCSIRAVGVVGLGRDNSQSSARAVQVLFSFEGSKCKSLWGFLGLPSSKYVQNTFEKTQYFQINSAATQTHCLITKLETEWLDNIRGNAHENFFSSPSALCSW